MLRQAMRMSLLGVLLLTGCATEFSVRGLFQRPSPTPRWSRSRRRPDTKSSRWRRVATVSGSAAAGSGGPSITSMYGFQAAGVPAASHQLGNVRRQAGDALAAGPF